MPDIRLPIARHKRQRLRFDIVLRSQGQPYRCHKATRLSRHAQKIKARPDLSALGARPALGPLEAQLLEIVCEQGRVTVRDVYSILREPRDLAYTTVMTVLHNLHCKGLLV